ncbi:RNA polymerase recycling motor ATPase HelR [Brachybacterium tyrofermentans]|uniref:RNA polymerase recycling motor ATPase HelR n=1 Tax=Brachybacterium tyrofermentans TaxID=47848 RepID=UPI003FD32904
MTVTRIFELRDHRTRKAAPARIAADDAHFRRVAQALSEDILEVRRNLEEALLRQTGDAAGRVEREARVDHFRARLHGLQRVQLDAVLGRMTPQDGSAPIYVGRLAVHDAEGAPLLVDWRSQAAEPFFAATRAHPRGLLSRRRYRWEGGRIRDYWDETLGDIAEGAVGDAELGTSPDEESALLDALTRARTPQMGTVLTTLAADQDAIIRAGSRRPLVVDGGPGTGKTVVALHRTAYLLYTDPRLRDRRGGVLVVGPHQPYLRYVADVLPSLGEEDVVTCTLADLVPEGAHAVPESDPEVAALKAGPTLVAAIEPAVALYEEAPEVAHLHESAWGPVQLEPEHFADAFEAVHPSTPHNLARDEIWEELAEIVLTQIDGGEDPDVEQVREELVADEELVAIVHRAWPLLEATDLVGDLFEVPAYLRRCAPALSRQEVQLLQREQPRTWSAEDLPLLDAARYRLGDPGTDARRRRQDAARRETVEEVELMTDYLIASDSSDMQVMSMLRGEDLRTALAESTSVEVAAPDALAGPFAHVVVDEAQELSDAQWAMVLRRCPSESLTLVGDRAQAAHGFTETWEQRLSRVGLERVERSTLSLNYRTPAEVMEHAEPVIRAALPDANVPTSIRESGLPVGRGRPEQLEEILQTWLVEHEEGTVCVIGEGPGHRHERVTTLPPHLVKGLEFDLVVLVEPESFGGGIEGAVARYVAMTRATQELVVLSAES